MATVSTASTGFIYLVVDGDVESHGVLMAFGDRKAAVDHAENLAVVKGYVERDGPEDEEIALWVRTGSRHKGRLFGYIAVEKHAIVDWIMTWASNASAALTPSTELEDCGGHDMTENS